MDKGYYGIKQSSWAWFQKFSEIVETASFRWCHSDHLVFVIQRSYGEVIVIYLDDIFLTSDDKRGLENTKKYLQKHFVTKDLGGLEYFLEVERAFIKKKVVLS